VEHFGDSNEIYEAVLCNYFSIGMDAQVANSFHTKRNANPEKFKSQIGNQLWYARLALPLQCGCQQVPVLAGSCLDDSGISLQVPVYVFCFCFLAVSGMFNDTNVQIVVFSLDSAFVGHQKSI
jgi:hypothetical protein